MNQPVNPNQQVANQAPLNPAQMNQQQAAVPTLFDGPANNIAVAGAQAGEIDTKLGGMQYPRLKVLNHGIFYMPVGGDKKNPIQLDQTPTQLYGAIVRTTKQMTRVCFDKAYDPTGTTSPVVICRSGNGSKPDADIAEKPSTACASCQFNQPFSAGDGTKAKKCKLKLPALVVPALMQDDGQGGKRPVFFDEVMVMTINSTSILGDSYEEKNMFNLSVYDTQLSGRGAKMNHVLTTFVLDQRAGMLCKSLFTASYVFDDQDVARLQEIIEACPYDLDEMLGASEEEEEAPPPPPPGNGGEVGTVAATGAVAPVATAAQPAAPPPPQGVAANAQAPHVPPAPTQQAQPPAAAPAQPPAAAPAPAPQAQPPAAAPAPQAQPPAAAPPPPAPAPNAVSQPPAAPPQAQAVPAAQPNPAPVGQAPAAAPPAPDAVATPGVVASPSSGAGQPGPDAVSDPGLSW